MIFNLRYKKKPKRIQLINSTASIKKVNSTHCDVTPLRSNNNQLILLIALGARQSVNIHFACTYLLPTFLIKFEHYLTT